MPGKEMTKNSSSSAFAGSAATKQATAVPHRDGGEWHIPGQSAMWIFVFGDLFIFGGWFSFYMFYRSNEPDVFLQSQRELSQAIGVFNTLILLLSSWFIALCVEKAREQKYRQALTFNGLTFACALLFAGSKIYEWTDKIQHGFTLTTNDFFMFYFFLTAVHVGHVLIGFIVLGVVFRELKTPEFRSVEIVETGATYWHMVDLLWVAIFALVYLMR